MDSAGVLAVLLAVIGLLGAGGLGKHLLDGWSERQRIRAATDGATLKVQFTDNEQARQWLREQLEERDAKLVEREAELREFRAREIALMERVANLAERVARQDERMSAQEKQIIALGATVAKWGTDYAELKAERDNYRDAKHDADNRLAPLLLRATMAERDLALAGAEIDRLHERLADITPKERTP